MLSMQKLKDMTDAELVRHLKESGIAHGPIVESTRTLYEKKLFEYERKKKSFPNAAESSYETKQEYSSREYDANQGDYKTYEEEKYTKTYNYPQAHQRVKDDGRSKTGDKYQHISQGRHQSSYSQGVEARRPIRPLSREPESLQQPKRYIPLTLQMVVLLLFTGCLVFLYFRETKQNPFKFLQEILRRKK